jgi:hypothetical protein
MGVPSYRMDKHRTVDANRQHSLRKSGDTLLNKRYLMSNKNKGLNTEITNRNHTFIINICNMYIFLKGNIAELGNNVYQYGTRDQGEKVGLNDRGDSRLCRKRV